MNSASGGRRGGESGVRVQRHGYSGVEEASLLVGF